MSFTEDISKMVGPMHKLPELWDGRKSIVEMKDNGYGQWKQMEWIGWYFQFLCARTLRRILEMPGPRFGNAEFDAMGSVPLDFKAHAMNTSSHQIIVNDSEATAGAIGRYGAVGLVLALGEVEYNDENRAFQAWHNALKGGESHYEVERKKRGAWSRLRKRSFRLKQISFVEITDDTLIKCGSFQTDFRNADGSPRRSKVLLDLEKIDDEIKRTLEF